ncbi:hypothetical protein RMATCC62417_09971 [Rhizopus microsporus]|nr:hypothetical protein RMATCC62417_09971 [Rhizopus microsporus]
MAFGRDSYWANGEEGAAVACFISGIAVILMGYSVYSHLRSIQDRHVQIRRHSNRSDTKLEDSINLDSLAYLMQSPNANIQSSAAKIILERAMSATHLPKIIAACADDQPMDIRSKSLYSLQLLTRKEGNKAALLQAGALNVLVDALKCTDPDMKEVTQRYVAVAICDLIQGSDINKYKILELGILEPIKRILTSKSIRNNELKYWTLMILYQISLSDPLPHVLIDNGFVSLLAKMARLTYGNTNMPKFCMQSLVRITSNVDVAEAKKILLELLDYNIIELISICLRGDDVELIYWAAGLMHEFVIKDVVADKFRQIKGIHTILSGLLSAEEMYISRVILRTIKFMAAGQDKFLQDMVRSGMVKKIMHCLSLNDEDVKQWAILCIHVVAGQVESHQDIITAPEFEILLELAISSKMKVAIYVSDIISLICCITSNATCLEPHIKSLLKTLNTLLLEGESDVQYNAAGAIFNIMTTNTPFANKVRQINFKNILSVATTATNERVQMICTKGALMVVIKNRYMVFQINSQVTDPLIETVNSISKFILPIMISQALVRSTKNQVLGSRTSSIHDDELDPPLMHTDTDDEDIPMVRQEDYIDVTEEGTISNASRLDRVLKDRERAKKKGSRNNHSSHKGGIGDSSRLFNTALSVNERDTLFKKFELPAAMRNQLAGALTSLNILLENDQVIGSTITGKRNSQNMMDMIDVMLDFDELEGRAASYIRTSRSGRLTNLNTHPSEDNLMLPDHIRQLTENLVYLVTYPALQDWADSCCRNYPLNTITETRASELYMDALQWIYTFSEFPQKSSSRGKQLLAFKKSKQLQQQSSDTSINKNSSGSSSSSSSDEDEDDNQLFSISSEKKSDKQDIEATTFQKPTSSYGSKHYAGFSRRALTLLQSLTRYASVRQYLIHDMQFIKILLYLLEADIKSADRTITCLGALFANDPCLMISEHQFQMLAILVWHSMINTNKKAFQFYSQLVLAYCSRIIASKMNKTPPPSMMNNPVFVEIDLVSRSKFCFVSYESYLRVRNDSWTFETVRATHCVPAMTSDILEQGEAHKYAYEVILESSGLMQIGWVSDHFEFDPEGGKGVGDDVHSFGYDGSRAKKWHGKYSNMRTTSYGLIWKEGDVVTCAIDMDEGEIRYYLNGIDMGVAFFGISINRYFSCNKPTMQISIRRFNRSIKLFTRRLFTYCRTSSSTCCHYETTTSTSCS